MKIYFEFHQKYENRQVRNEITLYITIVEYKKKKASYIYLLLSFDLYL